MTTQKDESIADGRSYLARFFETDVESEPRPTFFLDQAIDGNLLAEALTEAGANFCRHRDYFDDDEEDSIWLPEVGKRGWFVLTRDARFRYNALEQQALRSAEVGAFVLIAKGFTGPQIVALIIGILPTLEKAARETERPFITKIYRDGNLVHRDLD